MEVQHKIQGKSGFFYLEENDKRLGTMTYRMAGDDRLIIEHTEVSSEQEGKGLGRLLVKAAVDYAREKHFKISPLCPYAKHVFEKTPEYSDVLF